jgi:tetratricopeptide (TPR) repeat protein
VSPHTTGRTYCNMLSTCDRIGDVGRAAEWQAVTERWSEPYADSGFPGICRVFRAGLLRMHGKLTAAEREAQRAAEELGDFLSDVAGEAFYELGEIQVRAGNLPGAEAMFAEAHARGRSPQPGLALLRLAQGNSAAARAMIDHCVAQPGLLPLDFARLLPARVEIALACGAVDTAAGAMAELEAIAATYGSPALAASAAYARGAVELAFERPSDAVFHLQRGLRTWSDIELPFEVAQTRLLLARAYAVMGRRDEADLEERAAHRALERMRAGAFTTATRWRAGQSIGARWSGDTGSGPAWKTSRAFRTARRRWTTPSGWRRPHG